MADEGPGPPATSIAEAQPPPEGGGSRAPQPPAAAAGAPGRPSPKKARRKMRRRSKLLLAAALLVGLVLGGVGGVSWQAGQSLLHPDRDTTALTPSALNMTWAWANFTTADDVRIAAWWIPAAGAANGTVVFLHGYSESKAQGLPLFPLLRNASLNILALDFRAHGESAGAFTTAGMLETREVDAAIAWVVARTGQGEPSVVLLGWSMGAAAALNAARAHPDLAAIVAESSFTHLRHIVDTSIGKFTGLPRWPFGPLAVRFAGWSIGMDMDDNAPVDALPGYARPLLLIQGMNDTTVTPDQVDALAAAAPQAEVWRVPGAEHTECLKADPDGYATRLLGFLEAHVPDGLPSGPPPTPSPPPGTRFGDALP